MRSETAPGFDAGRSGDRGHQSLLVKARLRPGVTLPRADAAVGAVAAQLTRDRVESWDPAGQFALLPLTDVLLFPPMDVFVRAAAWLLMVVVGLVLLLACTNLASFLLARALDRRREVAVRLALGASRGSLVPRLLTETTLLGLLAGGAGVGLGVWSLNLLTTADLPLPTPVTLDLRPDANVLGFTFSVSIAAGALLGLVPALQGTRPDVAGALRSENAGGGEPGQLRWRNALVVAQVAISLVLLVGAGLFLRSFQRVQSVDPGFGHEPAALMTFMTPATRFTPDEARAYTRCLLDRFRALPGVEAVGAVSNLHLNPLSQRTSDFNVDGFEPPTDHGAFIADRVEVEPGFFEAAGIEIVRGRNLQRRRPVGHAARGYRQRSDGPALLGGRRRRRPAGATARRRSPLARRRRGERCEREAARRASPQHGLSAVLATVHAVAVGRGEDVPRPGADGARPAGRGSRARSRPAGPVDAGPPHARPPGGPGAHGRPAGHGDVARRCRGVGCAGPGPAAGPRRGAGILAELHVPEQSGPPSQASTRRSAPELADHLPGRHTRRSARTACSSSLEGTPRSPSTPSAFDRGKTVEVDAPLPPPAPASAFADPAPSPTVVVSRDATPRSL